MRQLFFTGKNRLEWKEQPDPVIDGPGQALVRPKISARCDLDLPIVQGSTLFRAPLALGHEFSGVITALSDDVRQFRVGDRVAVIFQLHCGSCPMCRADQSHVCSTVKFASMYSLEKTTAELGSGTSDLVKVPYASTMLLKIPDHLSWEATASLTDNITDGWRGIAVAPVEELRQSRVLIVSGVARSIGMYAALIARALGVPDIRYFSTDRAACDRLSSLGFRVEHGASFPTRFDEADIVFECSGDLAGFHSGIRSVRAGGIFTSASIFFNNRIEIPFLTMYNMGIRFHMGRPNSRRDAPQVLRLISEGSLDATAIIDARAGRMEAADAWMGEAMKLVLSTEN